MEAAAKGEDAIDDYDELYAPSTPPTSTSNLAKTTTEDASNATLTNPDPVQLDDDNVDDIYGPQESVVGIEEVKDSSVHAAAPTDQKLSTLTEESIAATVKGKAEDIQHQATPSNGAVVSAISSVAADKHNPADRDDAVMAHEIDGVAGTIVEDASTNHNVTDAMDISQPSVIHDQDASHHVSHPSIGTSQETVEGSTVSRKAEDPDFLAAAEANKGDAEAEWQYDSSDMDTSSSDSDSDDSSSDESDEANDDYKMMDPAEAAKMLMAEEGGDDEDGNDKSGGGKSGIRSKNEKPEVVVPKPDVVVTPEMRVVALGKVQNIVENFVLVKAFTSGEYQVLEQGSVLCLEDRSVIGAVAETFGRVQEPLYSIAFTNRGDIDAAKIAVDTVIYYVEQHSTFVFTEPLKAFKGTDASNIHDEEVGEDEIEFSDDEAEAAYKRAVKQAKRGGKAQASDRSGRHGQPESYETANFDRRIISYDDDGAADTQTLPLAQDRARQPGSDRGRGRGGRGRGRGDRGGGRGGRGGRGAFNNQDHFNQRSGPANSFPDQHNHGYGPPAQNQHFSQSQVPVNPQYQGQYNGSGVHIPQQQTNPWPANIPYSPVPPPPPPGWPQQQTQQGQSPSWMQSLQQPYQGGSPHLPHNQGSQAPQGALYGYQSQPVQHPQQGYVWQQQGTAEQNAAYQAALQQAEMLRRMHGGQQ